MDAIKHLFFVTKHGFLHVPLSGKLPRIVTSSPLPAILLRETMQSIVRQLLPARMQLAQAPTSPQFDIKGALPSGAEQRSIERYGGRPLDSKVRLSKGLLLSVYNLRGRLLAFRLHAIGFSILHVIWCRTCSLQRSMQPRAANICCVHATSIRLCLL